MAMPVAIDWATVKLKSSPLSVMVNIDMWTNTPKPPIIEKDMKRIGKKRPTVLSANNIPYSQITISSSLLFPAKRFRNWKGISVILIGWFLAVDSMSRRILNPKPERPRAVESKRVRFIMKKPLIGSETGSLSIARLAAVAILLIALRESFQSPVLPPWA